MAAAKGEQAIGHTNGHTNGNVKGDEQVVASVLCGKKDLRLEHRNLPHPGENEVQVQVLTTGLCGSDLHYYNHYANGDILIREPLTLGHESAGVITAVGSNASNELKVGDRVALEVGMPCEKCELCNAGRYNICKEMRFRSSAKSFPHFQGTLQARINCHRDWVYKLPPAVSLTMAALLEPLSVALHASHRASLSLHPTPTTPKKTILVLGAGAVGLLCAAISKLSGSTNVIIADIQSSRLTFATENKYADHSVLVPMKRPQTIEDKLALAKEVAEQIKEKNGEVDLVFECTGQESCVQAAIYATKPGGQIMLIGMGNPIQTLPVSAAALREIDLKGVFRYSNTYPEAITLVASSNPLLPDLEKLVTQRFKGFDRITEAFEMAGRVMDDEGSLVLKVMVDTWEAHEKL